MEKDLEKTGVVQVDGAWATRITYTTALSGADAGTLDLRFLQDRTQVARATLKRAAALEVLGERNIATIDAQIAQANKEDGSVKGELKGRKLSFREITLSGPSPQPENSIEVADARTQDRQGEANQSGWSGVDRFTDPKHKASAPVTEIIPAANRATGESPPNAPTASAQELRAEAPALNGAASPARTTEPKADAVKAAGTEQNPPKAESIPQADAAERNPPAVVPVPPHIAARYQVKENRYHFDDETLAFVDRGTRLTVETENKAVLRDLIDIAQARGWQAVTVRGTQSFRRAAWREAYEAGLEVKGYQPTDRELNAADPARTRHLSPKDAPSEAREPASPPAARDADSTANGRPESDAKVQYGKLVTHGAAPYRDDPKNSMSYFVTIQDLAGNLRTQWGVGLKEAMARATTAPNPGDAVGLERIGSKPVSFVMRKVDANGELVTEEVAGKRSSWIVEKAEYFEARKAARQETPAPKASSPTVDPAASRADPEAGSRPPTLTADQERAAAIRSAIMTRDELQLKYPDINRAIFAHMEAHEQFADAFVKAGLIRESDRTQVIAQMRERLAGQVESAEPLVEPDNKKIATLISRSVLRVANEIGRTPVEVTPARAAMRSQPPRERARDDPAVRA
jgi:putative DNA primase/helicase